MSHPQEPTRQPTTDETARYASTLHNLAVASVVIAPALALLPPRKLDVYTLTLTGITVYSANHLYRTSYGHSIWDRLSPTTSTEPGSSLPTDRAREFQKQFRAREEERKRAQGGAANEPDKRGLVDRVWMGSEKEGWSERREKEVQKKLDEGKGYGDIIMDQIWEVWNWGKAGEDGEGEK